MFERPAFPAGTHRLHQDIVLAIEEGGSGVLVQGLHVVPGRQGWPVIHAATGMSFLDLQEARPQMSGEHRHPLASQKLLLELIPSSLMSSTSRNLSLRVLQGDS